MFDLLLANHSLYALFKIHWVIIVGLAGYFYITKLVRSPLYTLKQSQTGYFFFALFLLLLIKATPIDVIGKYYLFSGLVFQLAVTFFVIVPLVLLSLPVELLRQIVWNHRTKLILNILSHPWISLILFNGLLSIYLIPGVFNLIKAVPIIHMLFHIVLVVNAFFMWWVIVQPLPEIKGLDILLRALYIFLASLILIPIGFYYVIVQQPHLPFYLAVEGTLFPGFTLIYDQQLSGGILKIFQLGSYAFALLFLTLNWGKDEEAREGTVEVDNLKYVRGGVVIHLKKSDNDKPIKR